MAHNEHTEISLIPGGCLQFWDARLNLDELPKQQCFFREEKRTDTDPSGRYTHYLRCLEYDKNQNLVDKITHEPGSEDYTKDVHKVIDTWDDTWMPVPFLRRLEERWKDDGGDRFACGPSNWARCRVKRLDGKTIHLTLAFDTTVETPPPDDQPYFALAPTDVAAHSSYMLADHVRDNSWFLAENWVDQWIERVYEEHQTNKSKGRYAKEDNPYVLEHLAEYLTWLQVIKAGFGNLKVRVINPANNRPVDVDLILDIGNARSTGILVETKAQSVTNLNNSYLLQLRDLSCPEYIYEEPFETKVEFAEVDFGDASLSRASGRVTTAFAWPSAVRVGPEASRLPTQGTAAQGTTGMSSPKRYLWDERPWLQTWRYNSPNEPQVTRGLFAQQVNEQGTPIECANAPEVKRSPALRGQNFEPAFEAKFTRSSLMLFMVGEIISQALVTINAPQTRLQRELPDVPRRLRRIIFTVPTAMPVAEKRIFRRWVRWAVLVIWNGLGWQEWYTPSGDVRSFAAADNAAKANDYRISPQVRCDWDEASCTQLVHLYNELIIKHHGDAHHLFRVMGKPRETYNNKPCIRMASIDIGGGTMDLSITAFELASNQGDSTHIAPHMEFRDGFNLAGDEVLRSVILKHVLPQLESAFREAGVVSPSSIITQLMGRDYTGNTLENRNLRARFVRQVAVPVALGILGICEQIYQRSIDTSEYDTTNAMPTFKLKDFFLPADTLPSQHTAPLYTPEAEISVLRPAPYPQKAIIAAVDALVVTSQHGADAPAFSLMETDIRITPSSVEETIRTTLGPNLAALCEVVYLYDCDLLLLTGRPSAWRGVVDPVLAKLPVPPDRIIPMRQYHVGDWYPFVDVCGRITDPKTTVMVGAILCALAEGHLEGFNVDVHALQLTSTARYIGELTPKGELLRSKVWFTVDVDKTEETEQTHTIRFGGPLAIGYRQIDVERWPTTRYHLLAFADEHARARAEGKLPYEVTVSFRREELNDAATDDRDEGDFRIESIVDKAGNNVSQRDLAIHLQTLELDEGYWLDTGIVTS